MKKMNDNHIQKNAYFLFWIVTLLILLLLLMAMKKNSLADWQSDEDGVRYELEDGSFAIGFSVIDDERYYFDEDGILQTGKFYVESENAYYYANKEGIIQTGEIKTKKFFYIADENGVLQSGFVEYEGDRYYFNSNIDLVLGWFKRDGNWYYAGEAGVIQTGFVTIEGYRYYLNPDGTRVSDAVVDIDGVTYVFNPDGSVDENGTQLYPVFSLLNSLRVDCKSSELLLNSKAQACAILRAKQLVDGFDKKDDNMVQQLLANHGVLCAGGYEFSYGGLEGYGIEQLMENMQKDVQLSQALCDSELFEVGLGMYVNEGISYYDIILLKKGDAQNETK